MVVAKIFFCILAVFGAFYSIAEFTKNRMKLIRFITWLTGSFLLFVIVLFAEHTTKIANMFGVGRGVDFIFYLGFLLVFLLILKLFQKVDEMNSNITKIVRHLALDKAEREKKDHG